MFPWNFIGKWMMGTTSLEAYNTVYNITHTDINLEIPLKDEQMKELGIDIQLVMGVECLQ